MASEVEICNSALVKVGAARITSLTDNTKGAALCNEIYARTRDELLRSHQWNFATKRQKLAQITGQPVHGYDYHYQLPSDHLRTVGVYDNDTGAGLTEYRIENGKVLTNASDIYLVYVARITDPNEMPPDFREVLAYRLAIDLAVGLANSNSLSQTIERRFQNALAAARSTDSIEDWSDPMPEGSWVAGRL